MKKSRTYQDCAEIVTHLVEQGYTYQVSFHELRKAIVLLRGGDPRTVKTWMENLVLLGFIIKMNPNVFKLNMKNCPEALERMVKIKGQKRLL